MMISNILFCILHIQYTIDYILDVFPFKVQLIIYS